MFRRITNENCEFGISYRQAHPVVKAVTVWVGEKFSSEEAGEPAWQNIAIARTEVPVNQPEVVRLVAENGDIFEMSKLEYLKALVEALQVELERLEAEAR